MVIGICCVAVRRTERIYSSGLANLLHVDSRDARGTENVFSRKISLSFAPSAAGETVRFAFRIDDDVTAAATGVRYLQNSFVQKSKSGHRQRFRGVSGLAVFRPCRFQDLRRRREEDAGHHRRDDQIRPRY